LVFSRLGHDVLLEEGFEEIIELLLAVNKLSKVDFISLVISIGYIIGCMELGEIQGRISVHILSNLDVEFDWT